MKDKEETMKTYVVAFAVSAFVLAGFAAGCTVKTAEIAQKTCPVMGGKIDPKVYVEYKDRKIYFCCPGCEKAFNKDPEKYVKKVDAEIAKAGS
jgi:YHS domain-containing protein